ncbi:SDR family NAD(P)-dependent oxidoreductase [Dactylosporangium sp. NPDC000555]|uniref:SDR family NAD(P)-dependent oxidoreductase n=1 Tax=Dactylosporangium sp. NPDC000555 TaxID=3154260 RepID=UPI00331C49C9
MTQEASGQRTRRLAGKVCVITGTAGGQGQAAAVAFAREGAIVVGSDLRRNDDTVARVRAAGGTIVALDGCDLTTSSAAQALVDLAVDEFGRVDVLYCNAAKATFAWFDDMTPDMFWTCLRQELDPVLLPCKAVWPVMKAAGRGSIICTASLGAARVLEPLPGLAHSSAKAAVVAFARQLAFEGARFGVRVNSISPGVVATPATEARLADPQWREGMMRLHMLPRLGTVDDVAAAALFLASDESSWVTASDLAVDGGSSGL